MRKLGQVNYLVVHCSATKVNQDIGVIEIRKWHMDKGWDDIGYHHVIKRDGAIEDGRPAQYRGAHVKGHNYESIGICMVGGIDDSGEPEDNFTRKQYNALAMLLSSLKIMYPKAKIKGHRDFSPDLNNDGVITKDEWMKVCPCFDVDVFVEKRAIYG